VKNGLKKFAFVLIFDASAKQWVRESSYLETAV
jgi:hypothetical protein